MTPSLRVRLAAARALWTMNPVAVRLAGIAPWWVVLESTGRKSGLPRRVPLATGPLIDGALWLISVHGRSSAFGRNISAQPEVRVKLRRRWHAGTARLVPIDPAILARFSLYARLGPRTLGVEPTLVQIELHPG